MNIYDHVRVNEAEIESIYIELVLYKNFYYSLKESSDFAYYYARLDALTEQCVGLCRVLGFGAEKHHKLIRYAATLQKRNRPLGWRDQDRLFYAAISD